LTPNKKQQGHSFWIWSIAETFGALEGNCRAAMAGIVLKKHLEQIIRWALIAS